ncbi:hypothetical protein CPB83DRAFT_874518 [Crepidotus variabilis]|uniref:Uncharacterized protein n=1 Tax=Crepidotus variabilis TaxID=179855 RepID=A0A9P6EKS8_9AGAR|nr:hypothetical protein CPB83DRAFT_874518 [Crepidotus variabilis]
MTSFIHPPHPSQLVEPLSSISEKEPILELEEASRDPHELPSFNSQLKFDEPVLYLPPLLSSLPEGNPQYPPLVTETRLPNIDPASLSLHKALHNFKPLTSDYAATPYGEAFNWSQLKLPVHEEREWYCVVFRSKRKVGSDGISLYEADKLAHEEAIRNGGLILYWYGIPNPQTGMNLATCIWQSRKHASAANSRPHHIKAMRLAANAYEIYSLERYRLRKSIGEDGVTIEPYLGGDVGW